MRIQLTRRGKKVMMEIPDILIDLNPKPTRHVLMELHPMVTEFLADTAINQSLPQEKPNES